jgi:hypothetical protein
MENHNMSILKKLILSLSITTTSVACLAADVEIEWKNIDNYTDIMVGNTLSKRDFKESLMRQFEETFKNYAESIPNKYHLKITMIDVDLAGTVTLGLPVEVRTVTDQDFPRLKFYVVVYDENNNIVLQGVQNLKDQNIKHSAFRMKGSQSDFYLEKDLIKKWFERALIPAINKL